MTETSSKFMEHASSSVYQKKLGISVVRIQTIVLTKLISDTIYFKEHFNDELHEAERVYRKTNYKVKNNLNLSFPSELITTAETEI